MELMLVGAGKRAKNERQLREEDTSGNGQNR